MKKIIAAALCFVMIFTVAVSFTACGKQDSSKTASVSETDKAVSYIEPTLKEYDECLDTSVTTDFAK